MKNQIHLSSGGLFSSGLLKREFPALILMAFAIAIIAFTDSRRTVPELEHPLLIPPKQLEYFVLGYKELAADILWLRLIQDFDHCETLAKAPNGSAQVGKGAKCAPTDEGWTYHMLDAITRMAPKFEISYELGASMLSVVIHDREGARLIFERGMETFPEKWTLPYKAAYHYMLEMQNPRRAAELLAVAGKNGAPGWVYSLAARLYSKEGQLLLAKSMLERMIEADPDGRWAPRFKEQLKEIEESLAKAR